MSGISDKEGELPCYATPYSNYYSGVPFYRFRFKFIVYLMFFLVTFHFSLSFFNSAFYFFSINIQIMSSVSQEDKIQSALEYCCCGRIQKQ